MTERVMTPRYGLGPIAAIVTALALLIAACGGDADTEAEQESPAPVAGDAAESDETDAPSDESAVFPVTVAHKYGELTIEVQPERVVSVGFNDQDDLLALGVVPIAIRDWFGDQPFATWPWAQDALGDAEPVVLASNEINFEEIAALDPDLIVGVSSGMTEEEYETLSKIAPTLAQSGDFADYGMPWQDRTVLIGSTFGRQEQAEELVAAIEAKFEATRGEHPEFADASAAVAFFFDEQLGAYSTSDTRSRILVDLGFTIPPEYDELAGDAFYASFSEEQIDLLDVDAVVWIASTDADVATIAGSELRATLDAAEEGREIFAGQLLSGAFSFASPLSLEFLLDELVPELAAAVDGDPATEVPSAAAISSDSDSASESDEEAGDLSPEAEAAMAAWGLVFDSAATFADKAPYLEDAASLEASNDGYASTGDGMGGIALEPTGAIVEGDTATVTYDVLFGGNTAYDDLSGTITLIDGTWVVGRDEFCGFLASARTPCNG